MNKKQKEKILAALLAELEAAKATREAMSDCYSADIEYRFDATCDRIRWIELAINDFGRPNAKIDARTADLVASNAD